MIITTNVNLIYIEMELEKYIHQGKLYFKLYYNEILHIIQHSYDFHLESYQVLLHIMYNYLELNYLIITEDILQIKQIECLFVLYKDG